MYKVYVSGLGTKILDIDEDVWEFIGKGSLGSLYEVRYTSNNSLVEEFMPF